MFGDHSQGYDVERVMRVIVLDRGVSALMDERVLLNGAVGVDPDQEAGASGQDAGQPLVASE
jgi:hypothetical protein